MKIEDFELNKWYELSNSNTSSEILISVIKKRIDNHDDFEFNHDYTKFRRIESWEEFYKELDNPKEISYKIECYNQSDVFFDYSDLPTPNFKTYDKKKFNAALGRK